MSENDELLLTEDRAGRTWFRGQFICRTQEDVARAIKRLTIMRGCLDPQPQHEVIVPGGDDAMRAIVGCSP